MGGRSEALCVLPALRTDGSHASPRRGRDGAACRVAASTGVPRKAGPGPAPTSTVLGSRVIGVSLKASTGKSSTVVTNGTRSASHALTVISAGTRGHQTCVQTFPVDRGTLPHVCPQEPTQAPECCAS